MGIHRAARDEIEKSRLRPFDVLGGAVPIESQLLQSRQRPDGNNGEGNPGGNGLDGGAGIDVREVEARHPRDVFYRMNVEEFRIALTHLAEGKAVLVTKVDGDFAGV